MLPLNGGEAPKEAPVVDDILVVVESGAQINDILELDIHRAIVEVARSTEEICIHAVVRHM